MLRLRGHMAATRLPKQAMAAWLFLGAKSWQHDFA